jgi:hypothetical protein
MSCKLQHFITCIGFPSLRCHVMRGWGLPWATHSSSTPSPTFTVTSDFRATIRGGTGNWNYHYILHLFKITLKVKQKNFVFDIS